MGTISRPKMHFSPEHVVRPKWLGPSLGFDAWSSTPFPNSNLTEKSSKTLPQFQGGDDGKHIWENPPAGQRSSRLPVFCDITRRGIPREVPSDTSFLSSSSGGSRGWESYCEDSSFSQIESRLAADLSKCLEIDDSNSSNAKEQKPRQADIFQKKEMEPKQWDHLRYTAEELCADVNFMEGVFVRLVDTKHPPSAKERLITLKQLSRIVTPANSLRLCVMTHSRRQVMFALELLLREKSLRQHVIAVMCKMFEDLDLLVELDAKDLVFAKKVHVFQDTIGFCDMQQVITLAKCLLKTSWAGIGSTLGLALIGRLIEKANSLDFKAHPAWLEECLPGLAFNVLQVKDVEAVYRIMGIVSAKHMLKNLSPDHEMFKGPDV